MANAYLHSHDDSSEPVPSARSEPVDKRLPTQKGKQTSQESASVRKWPRSNWAAVLAVKNADRHLGSQAQGYCCYPSGLHRTAVGIRNTI